MARLPTPGSDDGTWGDILNEFLKVEHNTDGTLKPAGSLADKADDTDVVHASGDETVGGVKTFSSPPVVPTPTASAQAASKAYVDSSVAAGAPDATTTSKGIVQLAGDLGGTAASPTVPGLAGKQAASNDLSAIAGLTPANDDLLQRKSGAWINRTPAQVKTDLALAKSDVGLSNVDNTSDANKPVSTAQQTALNAKADKTTTITAGTGLTGGGDLSTDRTLTVSYGTAAGTAAQGNDSRITGAEQTTNKGAASGYAPLDSTSKVPAANLPSSVSSVNAYTGAVTVAAGGLSLSGLTYWRQSLAGRYLAPTRAVFIGSSTTAGSNATTRTRRYTDRLGAILHACYDGVGIIGGQHVLGVDSGWSFGGSHPNDGYGLGLASVSLATSATMSQTFNPTTGFTLYFVQGPGQGSFTVSIDGGTATTIIPDTSGAANRHDGSWKSAVLTRGSHSILITATNACIISGVYVYDGDETSGVQVFNSGKGGTTAADFAGANASTITTRLGTLSPGLVAIMLGSNDYQTGVVPNTFKTNIQTIISNIKAGVTPAPSFLLIGTYRRLDVSSPTYPWSAYLQAMSDIAAADPTNVSFVDISAPYPSANNSTSDPWDVIDTDSIHQTDRGHAMMADLLAQALQTPLLSATLNSGGGLLDPSAISNLITWFKADALSLSDNTPVSSWSPSSGAETAALTASGANRPVYRTNRVNSLPSVVFTATSSQNMDTGAWVTARPVPNTVFFVGKFTTTNGNFYTGRSGVFCYAGAGAGGTLTTGAGATNEMTSSASLGTTNFNVAGVMYNGTSSAIYLNSRTPTTAGTTGTGAAASLPGLRLGTNSAGTGTFLDGEIAEILVYNRALTSTEITSVVTYLGGKYNIAIA